MLLTLGPKLPVEPPLLPFALGDDSNHDEMYELERFLSLGFFLSTSFFFYTLA